MSPLCIYVDRPIHVACVNGNIQTNGHPHLALPPTSAVRQFASYRGGSSSVFADTHESSIIFDRVVGSIGASIGADDYFSRGTDIPEESDLMDEHEDSSETKQEDSSETKQEE